MCDLAKHIGNPVIYVSFIVDVVKILGWIYGIETGNPEND
jgi:hypothetical protein